MEIFEELSDYRDSAKLAEECRKRIEEIEREEEDKRKATEFAEMKRKKKKKVTIVSVCVAVIVSIIIGIVIAYKPVKQIVDYKNAVEMLDSGNYDEAVSIFTELGDYQDSAEKLIECGKARDYKAAELLLDSGEYEDAKELFTNLGDYKNSADMVKKCDSEKEKKVKANIIELGKNGKVEEAYQAYCSAYFSEGKTYFTKFASDNGFKDKLQPYIDDLKKYVGTYVFDKKSGLSDCIITVDTEKMIFYIKQSTLEYSWQIKPSTYKLETVRYEKDGILLCIDYVIDTSKGTVTYEYRTYDGELVEEHTANKQ